MFPIVLAAARSRRPNMPESNATRGDVAGCGPLHHPWWNKKPRLFRISPTFFTILPQSD
jgi:hypothetical protein